VDTSSAHPVSTHGRLVSFAIFLNFSVTSLAILLFGHSVEYCFPYSSDCLAVEISQIERRTWTGVFLGRMFFII